MVWRVYLDTLRGEPTTLEREATERRYTPLPRPALVIDAPTCKDAEQYVLKTRPHEMTATFRGPRKSVPVIIADE